MEAPPGLQLRPTVPDAKKADVTLSWAQQPEGRHVLAFDGGVAELISLCGSAGLNEFSTQGRRLLAIPRKEGPRASG